LNNINGGYPVLTTAPIKVDLNLPVMTAADFNLTDESVDVTFDSAPDNPSEVLVYATRTLSNGRVYAKNQFRLIGHFELGSPGFTSPESVYSAYVAKFGTPALGANIQFALRRVVSSGQVSPFQKVTARIEA
jgi:hypothetical protein